MSIHVGQRNLVSPRNFPFTLVQPRSERVRTRHVVLFAYLLFDEGGTPLADEWVARVDGGFVGREACEARCIIGILQNKRYGTPMVRAFTAFKTAYGQGGRTSSEGGR